MVDRHQVMNFRVRAQQLDRDEGTLADTAVLDIGVQNTGPDGARWALAVRGVDVAGLSDADVVLLWTVRGAPHLYRRAEWRRWRPRSNPSPTPTRASASTTRPSR